MLILAFDTTLGACSSAVFDTASGAVLGHVHEAMAKGHAERLSGMVQDTMAQSGIGFTDLDRIAVTTGPGTFTGVRIGLAFARGCGLALGIPVIGVSTLKALAGNVENTAEGLPISVVMDARRDAVYTQSFSPILEALDEAACVPLGTVAQHIPAGKRLLTGSGVPLLDGHNLDWLASGAAAVPDSRIVAALAASAAVPDTPPAPVYLRAADAKPQQPLINLSSVKVEIIEATRLHSTVMSEIHGDCFPAGWSAEDIADMTQLPGTITLIATSDNSLREPVGFIMMRAAGGEAEVITLCVRPNMRRRGVARQLLNHALNSSTIAPVAEVFLEVRADNVAAKVVYEAAGFEIAGERPGYYRLADGSRADAVIMKLVR
jgi:tRNA threonylcarbamoyl adenosine modification protein YeaZ